MIAVLRILRDNTEGRLHMTIQQQSYVAGLIDGDGSIMLQIRKRNAKFPFRIKAVIVIYQDQKCYEMMQVLKQILGCGYLYNRNDHISEIRIEGFKNVQKILFEIFPFLMFKKKQANLILEALKIVSDRKYSINEFLEVVKISDEISEANYTSKNRKYTLEYITDELNKLSLIPVTTGSLNFSTSK